MDKANAQRALNFRDYWQKRLLNGTGIAVMDLRRQQPCTVWGDGWIIKFCFTLEEARDRLTNYKERGK